jgi:hypothetical protein
MNDAPVLDQERAENMANLIKFLSDLRIPVVPTESDILTSGHIVLSLILEPVHPDGIVNALQHAICGSMGKLLEPSVFSVITSLSCFSVIGRRDAINVLISLLFDGLDGFFSQLPSDSHGLYTRIGVFADSIGHLSAADRLFTFIYPPTSSNLMKGFSIRRRRREQHSSH